MPAPPVRPTDQSLAATGRIWKAALARQAHALMLLGTHWEPGTMDSMLLVPWEELGFETQCDITRELEAFLALCAQGRR